ncbi:MAG TPA: KEOPS complex kinase/ATPase Bud32 [Candidatus Nanoarchaeia archaeon]|nr:KEOPS complex kinase/ATPase Bud32 [Candidatus Nanoarchaeia archaeon]
MKEIARGAEAVIYQDKESVVKKRVSKGYRHPELDVELIKQRTKREAKFIHDLPILGPKLHKADADTITMDYLPGEKVANVLDEQPELAEKIGESLAKLHDKNMIHGDLTTSNMILTLKNELAFIDFGLSFYSDKIEDKAVDIHLFKEALESKHFRVETKAYRDFLKGYRTSQHAEEVLERLKAVEKRGRYKNKGS